MGIVVRDQFSGISCSGISCRAAGIAGLRTYIRQMNCHGLMMLNDWLVAMAWAFLTILFVKCMCRKMAGDNEATFYTALKGDILFPVCWWLADIFLSSWVVYIVRIFSESHSRVLTTKFTRSDDRRVGKNINSVKIGFVALILAHVQLTLTWIRIINKQLSFYIVVKQ